MKISIEARGGEDEGEKNFEHSFDFGAICEEVKKRFK